VTKADKTNNQLNQKSPSQRKQPLKHQRIPTKNNDYWPTSEPENKHTHHCYAGTTEDTTNGKIFTDQMGRFISPLSTGNTQLFILYNYDSNSIHAEPIKNRTAAEIV